MGLAPADPPEGPSSMPPHEWSGPRQGPSQRRDGLERARVPQGNAGVPLESRVGRASDRAGPVPLLEFGLGHVQNAHQVGASMVQRPRPEFLVPCQPGLAVDGTDILADVAPEDPIAYEGRNAVGMVPLFSMV